MPVHQINPLFTVTEQTGAYTVPDDAIPTLVLADATAAPFAVTLPAVVAGLVVIVKKIDAVANDVTVTPATGLVDGAASRALANQWDSVMVVCDGTDWFVASENV